MFPSAMLAVPTCRCGAVAPVRPGTAPRSWRAWGQLVPLAAGSVALMGRGASRAYPRASSRRRFAHLDTGGSSSAKQLGAQRSLEHLRAEFPDAPEDELWRFARARWRDPNAAVAMYRSQQSWRQGQGHREALRRTFEKVPFGFVASGAVDALDGTRVMLVQGARYELQTAEPEEYTLAICHVLDSIFVSEENRVTVLIDVRRGEGWPNPPAIKLLPFIQACARIISDHYPERLSRLIIFPVPRVAKMILGIVRRLLDPVTFNKFVLVTGDDHIGAPCNGGELRKYVTKESLPEHSWQMYEDL